MPTTTEKRKGALPPLPPMTNGGRNGKPPTTTEQKETPVLKKLKPVFAPPRILLNAVEGWGKTTMGAYAPEPAFLMAQGETGYETLLGSNLVPSVGAARIDGWGDLLNVVPTLTSYKTVVLDALGGFERLCHEFICARDFENDWGERGFTAYQKGYDVAITEWLKLLAGLDKLRDTGVVIVILSHCRIKTFKNPLGADYDRYVSDVHDKTWAVTGKWSDAILFGNFFSAVETERSKKPEALKKGKGIGGAERVIYTERRDAFDAKNRYGMTETIDIPNDSTAVWSTIWNEITNRKDK